MSVALVTGGQRGLGLGIAEALARDGRRVALSAEAAPGDPEVRAALARLPGATYHRHDLADVGGVAALLDAVEREAGPVTTLVQNAGVPARVRGDLLDLTPGAWDHCLGINLRGAFFLCQEAARRMLRMDGGAYRAIVLVTSVSAVLASPERAEYCVSKAGLSMAASLLALRLAPHVGVFELRPGIMDTPMTAGVRGRYDALVPSLVPMGRWGLPSDLGSVVVPIARGEMAFATGAAIPVDGGLSVARL